MSSPKFPELPVEVQVALINAASAMATKKIEAIGSDYNRNIDWFQREYQKICDALYKENRVDHDSIAVDIISLRIRKGI